MSKFFTDYNKQHTFSLDHVVSFKKGYQSSLAWRGKVVDMLFPTIEVTLVSSGALHNINILYEFETGETIEDGENRRDLDFLLLLERLQ